MRTVRLSLEWLFLVAVILITPIQIVNLIGIGNRGTLPWWFVGLYIVMLPPWCVIVSKSQWKRIKQITSVAMLMSALAASGSVPPVPVIRPAPLKSPRDASQPKSTPMVRTLTVPASEPAPVSWMEITPGLNLSGCDTNDPNCRLWFNQHYSTIHPAGYELTVRLADTVTAVGGGQLAWFGAAPYDRISEFNWPQQEPQPVQRYFKRILTLPILPASRTSAPLMWGNTNLGVVPASRKR